MSRFYNKFYPQYLDYLKKKKAHLSEFQDLFKTTPYLSKYLYELLLKDEKKRLVSKGDIDGFIDNESRIFSGSKVTVLQKGDFKSILIAFL